MTFNEPSTYSPGQLSALTNVPLFLGYIQSFLFQGILFVQVFIYYVSFPDDSRRIKALVWVVFFVECLSSFFAAFAAIKSLIVVGDLLDIEFVWAFVALAPLCGVVALFVHWFYAWRILIIGGSWIIPAFIVMLSIAQFAMVTISGQMCLGVGLSTIIRPEFIAINIVWLGGSAVCDIIITTTLVVLFRRSTVARLSETNTILTKLIALTVETGMVTAFGAVLELMFFLFFRNTFIHFILFYTLPKLYANCMMATLNARLMFPGRQFQGQESSSSDDEENSKLSFRTMSLKSSALSHKEKMNDTVTKHMDAEAQDENNGLGFVKELLVKPLPRVPRSASLPV